MFMRLYDSAFGISWVPTLGPAFCYCTWILFEVGRKWNDDQHISTHIDTKPWTILDIYGNTIPKNATNCHCLGFVWGFHVVAPFYPDLSQGERVKPYCTVGRTTRFNVWKSPWRFLTSPEAEAESNPQHALGCLWGSHFWTTNWINWWCVEHLHQPIFGYVYHFYCPSLRSKNAKNVERHQAWLFLMGKMGRSPLPDSLLEGKPSSGTHGPFKFAVFQLALANKSITNERVWKLYTPTNLPL